MKDKKLYIVNTITLKLKNKNHLTPREEFKYFNIPSKLEYEVEFRNGYVKHTYKHITLKGDLFDNNELIIKESFYKDFRGNIVGSAWELKYHDGVVSYRELNMNKF